MISRHRRLCLIAVFPAVCAASFAGTLHSSVIHGTHLRKRAHFERSEEEEDGGYSLRKSHDKTRYGPRVWYHSPAYDRFSRFAGTGVREPSMVSAGKKEDEQRDTAPVRAGGTQPDGPGSPAATAGSLDLAPASTPTSSAVEIPPSSSVLSGSSSHQSPSGSDGQAAHSSSSPSALATTPASSASSSSSLQPALLAFILVPVCIFLLGMMFALYRIYGRPGNRVPPASPLFLGDTTVRGSGYHRDEAISANEPTLQPRGSPLAYDKKGTIKWDPYIDRNSVRTGVSITSGSTPKDAYASQLLKPPVPTHAAGVGRYNSSPPSRVLRPYVPRPYHRPHPAYTSDPESVIPLILNGSKSKITNHGQGRYAAPNLKGKENIPQRKSDHAKKHRDDISTTPLNTSPRSLPFRDPMISAIISDADIRFQAKTQPSSSSVVSMGKDRNQLAVPPLSSTSTSFDIGLAMMSDCSSPNVGLGLDLSSPRPSLARVSKRVVSQTAESLKNGSLSETIREAGLAYLEQSVTAGSEGLADLSRDMTPPDKQGEQIEDELDIALALAFYKTQHASGRLQAIRDPVDQKSEPQRMGTEGHGSPVSSSSGRAIYTPTAVKAPTLPTLSEMALSRADPLYESVTNELFSSYGMRMSAANASQGQASRVSARISRMLSWFADPSASGNRTSVMENRMSCDDPTFSGEGYGERLSDVPRTPGVQPLRIGKVRKNAV